MNKYTIALLFLLSGLAYGSMAQERVYKATVGFLLENGWIKPLAPGKEDQNIFGTKPIIYAYSSIFIIIGLYILWKL